MKFGVALTTAASPVFRESEQKDYLLEASEISEAKGYESVWVSDRTLYPTDISERYPQQFGPGKTDPNSQNIMEALITLAFIAGKTKKLRLGTSVLVLPFRNPLLNTKMVSTLDVLSEGRLILGIGTGWMKEEFDSMGADYSERGLVTDEHLSFLAQAADNPSPTYHGEYISTSGMRLYPQRRNGRSMPIWVGGNSDRALVRTVKYGTAWHGINLTPAELIHYQERLKGICKSHQRDYSTIGITLRATVKITDKLINPSTDRPYLTGNLDQIEDDLKEYKNAGLDYLVISMAGDTTEEVMASITRFADRFL
jgi:probable F420-dependent oxidoreductase